MTKKLIGCTPRIIVEDGTSKQFINDSYVNALNTIDCVPVVLPMDIDDLSVILDKCDGFLVTGGSDITPSYFNQPDKGSKGCNERLDKIDKMVVEYAYNHKKPMMGICRGHQAINVFLGGDLIQDIGESHSHGVMHEVTTIKNRLLDFKPTITTNSYHHQVLDKLAPGLINIGTSKEGYSEAFIHETHPIISVQWHPERMVGTEVSNTFFGTFRRLLDENK